MFLKVYWRHGEKVVMWLKELTIAVVQKDPQALERLMGNVPVLHNPEDLQKAIYLLEEAKKVMLSLQEETAASMLQIKKNLDFLQATQQQKINRLDITS